MNEILAEAGIQAVLTGIRMPRMNSITERWVQSCHRPPRAMSRLGIPMGQAADGAMSPSHGEATLIL
jgi:hypothetical protein